MQKIIREVRMLRVLIVAGGKRRNHAHRQRAQQQPAAVQRLHFSSLPPVIIGGSTFGTISTSTK